MRKKEFLRILLLYCLWTGLLLLISYFADNFLNFKPSYPYYIQLAAKSDLPRFLFSFAGFDGVHYLTIAQYGYLTADFIQAFFPFYPFLIYLMTFLTGNYLFSGLILSQIFALSTLISFYYLVKLLYKKTKIAWNASLALVFFASSFFLHAFYNEGLFMTLLFSGLIAFHKKQYLLAASLGLLLSATRVTGIFIFPTYLLLFFSQSRESWRHFLSRNWQKILVLALSCLGLLAYMLYLYLEFKDPLYFFHVQSNFGAGRETRIILFPQVVWRYLKIITTVPLNLKYYSYVQEFILSIWGLLVLAHLTWQTWQRKIKFKAGYLFFAWASYFLPTMTGNFSSMPRYLLPIFPIFIYLALSWKNEPCWRRYLYLGISSVLLIINTLLFIQGYWVS